MNARLLTRDVKARNGDTVVVAADTEGALDEAAKRIRRGVPILGSLYRPVGTRKRGKMVVAIDYIRRTAWLDSDNLDKPGRPWRSLEHA